MNWALANPGSFWPLVLEHLVLAAIPTVLGLLLAVPVGMLVHGAPAARRIAVVVAGALFTIPSLALFVTIPALIGTRILDPRNVVIALTIYSYALLVRVVLDALDSVPRDVRDAAEAIGASRARRAIGVDLPLAVPALTAGARVVAVTNVSLVSVGAVIGIGGLGRLFTAGYQRDYPDQVLAGILGVLLLALAVDRALAVAGHRLAPWARLGAPGPGRAGRRGRAPGPRIAASPTSPARTAEAAHPEDAAFPEDATSPEDATLPEDAARPEDATSPEARDAR